MTPYELTCWLKDTTKDWSKNNKQQVAPMLTWLLLAMQCCPNVGGKALVARNANVIVNNTPSYHK